MSAIIATRYNFRDSLFGKKNKIIERHFGNKNNCTLEKKRTATTTTIMRITT